MLRRRISGTVALRPEYRVVGVLGKCRRKNNKFHIGQSVFFTSKPIGHMAVNGTYEVVKLLPRMGPTISIASRVRPKPSSASPRKVSSTLVEVGGA